ncbi:MAG: hypothetical protein QHJ73_17390, partial [Armatimonadota bacterium]|nr:hypothetical protein [Armatimonadota bacterium]
RYALARRDAALALHYCHPDAPPDFQSGFKVYSSKAVHLLQTGLATAAAEHPQKEMLRWGMELVPLVEVALAGGVFGEARRASYRDQPVTAYGSIDRPRAYGQKAIWVFQRCGVAPAAAAQMLHNALTRRLLETDPAGRAELHAFRTFVLRGVGVPETSPHAARFL